MSDAFPVPEPPVSPIAWNGTWRDGALRILDQTRLPHHEMVRDHREAAGVIEDIRRLAVRGAPVLGVAGAYALVLSAREIIEADPTCTRPDFLAALDAAGTRIAAARPTAVNLPAAVERGLALARRVPGSPEQVADALLAGARALDDYEREACAAIGRAGAAWLEGRRRFVTHCNAGALVTTGIGTALAPIYVLKAAGADVHVWVNETRPLLQGLRLTAYELRKAGVSIAVVADGVTAGLMRRGQVDAAIVGADRICANGDVVNKVGTYAVALAAHRHGVPFVVAAPSSTLDPRTPEGDAVPIEERPHDAGAYLEPAAVAADLPVYAPAFDVTPAALVTAIVSEFGVLTEPDGARLGPWLARVPGAQADAAPGR
jgi:methylthioribose-1-phosphate isomerase